MRRLIITLAVLAVFILPAWAQKIEIQKPTVTRLSACKPR